MIDLDGRLTTEIRNGVRIEMGVSLRTGVQPPRDPDAVLLGNRGGDAFLQVRREADLRAIVEDEAMHVVSFFIPN